MTWEVEARGEVRMKPVRLAFLPFLAVLVPPALADNDPSRDVPCVSKQIGVSEGEFRTCFLPVRPDPGHDPDGETQRANKAMLLPCLQEANPSLTNEALDKAMDACRPEGPS